MLADMGVKQIFGVTGGALNSLNVALEENGRIQWIGVRHEEAGAFAAGAQAQLNGKLAVCAGTVGPGAVHLLNALYDAKRNGVPVLAITGQVPITEVGTEYHQEVDIDYLFRDVSVFNDTIRVPSQMPRTLELAIEAALAHRAVATITIPGDVGPQKIEHGIGSTKIYQANPETLPAAENIQKAADLLNRTEKVTIFAGVGCSHGRDQVLQVAELMKAPIACSLRAKDFLQYDNPSYVGQSGLVGNPAAVHAMKSCDTLFIVGTDFPYRDWYPSDKTVIQIDLAQDHIGRRCPVDLGLVGDAPAALKTLLPLLKAKESEAHRQESIEKYQEWEKKQAVHAAVDGKPAKGLIRPEAVAASISALADDDAIFTADTGMCIVWASRFLQIKAKQRFVASFNHGSMANAMPQAIGAQALYPDRQVIALSGDGGFSMLMGDFITAVSYKFPIKVVIFNNSCFGMVKLEQEVAGLRPAGVELKNPNFAEVGKAMGALGLRVEKPSELQPALEQAFKSDGPAVVDVVTNPEELSLPPTVTVDEAWGFALSKLKGILESKTSK